MAEPLEARVREAAVTMTAVDGESLLSPQLMMRVVAAVLAALAAERAGEESRRRDTRVASGHEYGGEEHG